MLFANTMEHILQNVDIYLYCLLISLLLLLTINYYFFKTILTGLINFQISFAFNFAIVLYGFYFKLLPIERTIHFFVYELIVTVGIYMIYKNIINKREIILSKLSHTSFANISNLIILFNLAIMCMYIVFVPSDGGSRIEFMTSRWYSFVRPAEFILTPLGYFIAIYLYDHGKRLLPSLLLISLVLPNIASGSKATFVLMILSAFLIYRQLKGAPIVIPLKLKIVLIAFVAFAVKITLERLEVDILALSLRFIRTAEATIMVYFSDDPTAACTDVSMFAALHRGIAKLFGDPSAMNIDNVFGFALSSIDSGGHNFTGPNSQIASYMLCNFHGLYNVVAIAAILSFFLILWIFYKRVILNNNYSYAILFLPFLFTTLDSYAQSYDNGVSSLTIIMIIYIIIFCTRFVYDATKNSIIDNNYSG